METFIKMVIGAFGGLFSSWVAAVLVGIIAGFALGIL